MIKKTSILWLLLAILVLATSMSFSQVVINEVLYDTLGTDSGEFIELYGPGGTDISGWTIKLINGAAGTGTPYSTITIPAATSIPLNGFYVIGRSAIVPNVDLDFSLDNVIQNGNPDAIRLENSSAVLQDILVYEGDTQGGLAGDTIGEGATGNAVSPTPSGGQDINTLNRIPDGWDTNVNKRDFTNAPPSPGARNLQTTFFSLPLTDNFDAGENTAWCAGFTDVKTVTPASLGIPASTQGGDILFVQDSTGGGEEYILPYGNNLVNPTISGEYYVSTSSPGFPQQFGGIGFCMMNGTNWFSAAAGNGMEDGYYLVVQNAAATTAQSIFQNHPSAAGFYHVVATPFAGTASYRVATLLGSTAVVTPGAWTTFTLSIDSGANTLLATVGVDTLYSGVIPVGGPVRGSISVGYREGSTGNPFNTNGNQATVIDAITVSGTATVPVTLSEFKID